jgi:hypothetical protein
MNPKIVSFTPIKGSGSILGFCGLQIMVHLNGMMIPAVVKAKVVRNSQTGHIFISIHQEVYKKPDGSNGYSDLIKFNDKYKEFYAAAEKAWQEYCNNQNQIPISEQQQSKSDEFYPNGLARNTSAPKISKETSQLPNYSEVQELPF